MNCIAIRAWVRHGVVLHSPMFCHCWGRGAQTMNCVTGNQSCILGMLSKTNLFVTNVLNVYESLCK